MRPSKIKPGTKLKINSTYGAKSEIGYFIKRYPAECGRKAFSLIRFPAYAGLNGGEDDGTSQMSDYDLSRRGEFA